VQLLSLRLENFRQHKQSEFHFPKGLVGILGPNGAGKSTLLEAIAWALYGSERGVLRSNTEGLIWQQAPGKASALVELTFGFGGRTYTVKRVQGLNRSAAEFRAGGMVLANSTKAVNAQVQQLLGMSPKEFFNSYFTGQKELQFLNNVEGVKREEFIAGMLGYERLTRARGRSGEPGTIRDDSNCQEKAIAQLQGRLQNFAHLPAALTLAQTQLQQAQQRVAVCQAELQVLTQRLGVLEPERQQWEIRRSQHREHGAQRERLQQQQRQQGERLAAATQQQQHCGQLVQRRAALERELEDFGARQAEWAVLQDRQVQAARQAEQQRRWEQLAQEMAEDQTRLAEMDAQQVAQGAVETALAHTQAAIQHQRAVWEETQQQWQQRTAARQAAIAHLHQQQAEAQHQWEVMAAAGEDGACPTCERPLGPEFTLVLAKFQARLQEMAAALQQQGAIAEPAPPSLRAVLAPLEAEQKQLQKALQEHHSALARLSELARSLARKEQQATNLAAELATAVTFDAERYASVRATVARLQPLHEEWLKLNEAPQRLVELGIEITQQQAAQHQTAQTLAELERAIAALNFQEAAYQQHQTQWVEVQQQYALWQQQQAQAVTALALAEQEGQRLQAEEQTRQTLEQEQQAAQREKQLLVELDKAFTDLRQELNQQIRPQLAETASLFLGQLTDGRYQTLALDDKYQPTLLEDGEAKPLLSGGEEDLCNLCLRLAVSQILTERSGRPFSLLVLDEVFGSLDDRRRDRTIELLYALEHRFDQVLVITHIDGLKESLHHAIELEYDPRERCARVRT